MTDLALLCCFVMFVSLGFIAPFIWSLGYIWVDALLPQMLSYGLLNAVPMALIMGAGSVLSYLLLDRRLPPKITGLHIMVGVLAVWITLTTTWAVSPAAAWLKWDPSIKTLAFTLFLPFIFRSRVQIEAFVLTLVLASAPHLLPWGVKTFLTGGGYGMSLGLLPSMVAWIAESSAIAAIAVMFIPILAWVRQHSLLLPWRRLRTLATFGMSMLYLVATIGTFARTGLISLAILAFGMLLRSKRKITFILTAIVMGAVVFTATSDKWTARISTIADYQTESSAETRILVWKWTWDFAKSHPFGGGFNSFFINVIHHTMPDGSDRPEYGRAFHNIYFSSLGEHGYPGLALYLAILATSLLTMQKVIRQCRGRPDLEWAGDLARAGQLGLLIMMGCGNFIDMSYSFVLWDLIALSMCLRAHVYRVLSPAAAALPLPTRFGARPVAIPQFR